jgi:hypothetical protein
MRSRAFLRRLCAIPILALCLSCSSKEEASGERLADQSVQQAANRLLAKLLAESDVQTRVEAEAPPPASTEHAPGVEDLDAANACPPDTGPVAVLVVGSAGAVKSAAAQYAGLPILHRDAETVIFEDGRVITSNVEAVGDYLNELGWSGRELELLGSMPRRYASSGGGNWRTRSDAKKSPPRKRRRRRG